MLVVGANEQQAGHVSVRTRSGEQMNGIPRAQFEALLGEKVRDRTDV